MDIIGIICEYNPFHNGHLYHINKIKEIFPDSLIILVLNGYFLERGEVSLISKENKTKLSLYYGVDIVLELPFVFGTQSADVFADLSITILENLKCDYVVFGSESNDVNSLTKLYDYIKNNRDEYNEDVQKYLSEGVNYPTALAKALKLKESLKPNDLLGLSYIKSIKQNNYKIKPYALKRTSDYLDTESDEEIISATNIRNKLDNNIDIKKYVPFNTLDFIETINKDIMFKMLKYKIITDKNLSLYLDVDEGIDNRLKKVINDCTSQKELVMATKSKRYTYNKINRMLIHILIGFKKEDNNKKLEYIKVLGFNTLGKKYLNRIKKELDISLIPIKTSLTYKYEMVAANIYDLITNNNTLQFEHNNKPIKF